MAMPVSVPGERTRPGVGAAVIYSALVFAPGVLAWFVVIGMATVGFAGQVTKYDYEVVRPDVLGFAFAFAIAGTITGLVASATAGHRPWTIAFGAISPVLLGVSPAVVRWWIFRFTAPSAAWGQRLWESAIGTISTGLVVGSLFGILLSGLVLVAAVVERRMTRWQFGLMVAVAVAVLGSIGLPMIMPYVVELVILYAGGNFRHGLDEVTTGSAIGAGIGALMGAVIVGMIARGYAAAGRGRQSRAGQAVGITPTTVV
jgi:hypothetical protein